MLKVLRAVDNQHGVRLLQDCPHQLADEALICRENFLMYSTRTSKRKLCVVCMFLHAHRVIMARPRKDKKQKGRIFLEFYTAMEVQWTMSYKGCAGVHVPFSPPLLLPSSLSPPICPLPPLLFVPFLPPLPCFPRCLRCTYLRHTSNKKTTLLCVVDAWHLTISTSSRYVHALIVCCMS